MGQKSKTTKEKYIQNKIIPPWVKWATMPWLEGSTSLFHSTMDEELWLIGENGWRREGCGWLERKRCLKASMSNITVYKRSVSESDPPPSFYRFFGDF